MAGPSDTVSVALGQAFTLEFVVREAGPAFNGFDLDVRFERFAELAPHLPRHLPAVAESGIGNAADIESVAAAGYRLALIGSSLMRSSDPKRALVEYMKTF